MDTIDLEQVIDSWDTLNDDDQQLYRPLLAKLKDDGGDVQWEGSWYPSTLISEHYFEAYAKELIEELYTLPDTWPFRCIDWKQAANELRDDYTPVEFYDTTYYYRDAGKDI